MDCIPVADPSSKAKHLIKLFCNKFDPLKCQYVASSPGRVNLIGEHIDYCGYSVLPMALEQDVMMAFAVEKDKKGVILSNIDEQYRIYSSESNDYEINKSKPEWIDYFFCGYKGIMDYAEAKDLAVQNFRLTILVEGSVPPSSGLSSSSALVCCAALVVMKACNLDIPKRELASLCARCERYIGTEGGGMDQAISLLAEQGKARLIVFKEPLETYPVVLPAGCVFVVTNSLVKMNKAASNQFNQRVTECKVAAKVLAKLLHVHSDQPMRLLEVQELSGLSLNEMIDKVRHLLHENVYTLEELTALLDVDEETFRNGLTHSTKDMKVFMLRQRAEHVYSEAYRVQLFQSACELGDLKAMGDLMNQSHASCSQLYECSCPQLDNLVKACLSSGARGSRLTGAGWGGCCVSLVDQDAVPMFIDRLVSDYYSSFSQEVVSGAVFVSQPGSGARFHCVI